MRELMDDEGENQAVRCFLMAYGSQSLTLDKMMGHMKACGYALWPEWVETTEMRGHLTKAGAQLWLRHLFDLEKVGADRTATEGHNAGAQGPRSGPAGATGSACAEKGSGDE